MSYRQPRGGGRGGGGGGRGGRAGGPPAVRVFSPSSNVQPSPAVAKTENAVQAQTQQLGAQLGKLSIDQSLPFRPGHGTIGKKVVVWANYVELAARSDLTLYRYDMSVSPGVVGRKLKQIIRQLLGSPELSPFKDIIVSDFKSTLISGKKLGEKEIRVRILYRREENDEPRPDAPTYTVRLFFTNTLTVGDLVNHLKSTTPSAGYVDKQPTIQALNILLNHRSRISDDLVAVGSNKTFSLDKSTPTYNLGAGLMAVRGFFASVRAATDRILVNVNISHGVFYRAAPLNEVMSEYNQKHNSLGSLNTFVNKLRVSMRHLPQKTNSKGQTVIRVKTILGLATMSDGNGLEHPPRVSKFGAGTKGVQFWMEPSTGGKKPAGGSGGGKKGNGKKPSPAVGGGYISVYEYFQQAYGRAVNENVPVVNVGTRERPTYLPAEACQVLPGQNAKTKLNPEQTQNMIKFAVRKPCDNAESIVRDGLGTVGLLAGKNPLLAQFNLAVTENLLKVPGRILPAPKVVYRTQTLDVQNGSWNMNQSKFNAGGKLRSWSFIVVTVTPGPRNRLSTVAEAFPVVKGFEMALRQRGVDVDNVMSGKELHLKGPGDPALDDLLKSAEGRVSLLLVILPSANTPVYNRIKSFGDLRVGIHTICVVGEKFAKSKGQDQYFGNVALKFNLKLGGHNQFVESSRLGILNEDKTMVVGIDVTHPSPGSANTAPSIAGMVASIDKNVSQWPGILRLQSVARQEMVSEVKEMLKSRLRLWVDLGRHKTFPENVLVYRDGVSEGQYKKVVNEEIPLLREACREVYSASEQKAGLPRLTVIVVSKRHHTRFYPTAEKDADRGSNNPSGTIVDRGITEAGAWDFYLQAHAAIQGTARPAHYFVVVDEIFRAKGTKDVKYPARNVADVVEGLSQALCYTYGRATKAVSICAPVYYADILCERARVYLKEVYDATPGASAAGSVGPGAEKSVASSDIEIHRRLRNTMFYL